MSHLKRMVMALCFCCCISSAAPAGAEAPVLPAKGVTVQDFIPKGWQLLDSVTFDFNHDGLQDIAAVIEVPAPTDIQYHEIDEEAWNPRILFILQNTGNGYALSLQDENTIRTSMDGGIWGDPWEPLTAEGDAFTVNAYGGSNWRWAEHFTYKHLNGEWALTQAEIVSVFMADIRSEYIYDYESGRGKRMEANDCGKTITYDVKLDPPPPLKSLSFDMERLALTPKPPYTIKAYKAAAGIDIKGVQVPSPDMATIADSIYSKDYLGYRFFTQNKEYFAVYHPASQTVYVVAEIDKNMPGFIQGKFENAWLYKDRLYLARIYSRDLGRLNQADADTTKAYTAELIGMQPDGSEAQTLFTHQFETQQDYVYLTLICEFGGDEVVINVYGPDPQQYYRVSVNGGAPELLGELGGYTEEELEAYQNERYGEDN